MLWYVIDGWNLINKVSELKRAEFPWQELVFYIRRNRLSGSKNNKVTIVFDGRFNLEDFKRTEDFELIFSGQRPADVVIKEKVRHYKNRKQIIVVSNDRDIINYIRSLGANSLKVEEFLKKKEKKKTCFDKSKNIDYRTQRQITEELKQIWLKDF
jgi:predicted RNA-binding protein with PIN domain